MNKLKLVSALIISLSIGIIYAKDVHNINDRAEEIIYLYAEIIDSKNFSELKSIMHHWIYFHSKRVNFLSMT